ncbi:NUMOD4 motif-containing HNH endonuclease [Nocardia sp. NPDC049707]|uniref:NUMOD4 motif-containing HNH endonuclease n=1 Tax=Nocardia sp. NPDC049707 TaxID=3154735 RepID=UPI00342A53F5
MNENADSSAEERWLPVVGYEGRYSISSRGRVRSEDRFFLRNGYQVRVRSRILKPIVMKSGGYHSVGLCANGSVQSRKVHALVLEAFVGPRPSGMEVCHNNGVPTDNRLENLRYDTASANQLDKVIHGTHHNARKTHCKRGHEFTQANTYYSPNKVNVRECLTCKQGRDFQRSARAA